MLKIVRPVSFVLLSAAFCSGGVVHASDRAAITPRVGISQQEGSLKGTVSDSFGPVAGASIVVKGTTNGTVTDMNGNFVLDVKKGDVIRIDTLDEDSNVLYAQWKAETPAPMGITDEPLPFAVMSLAGIGVAGLLLKPARRIR